MYNEVFDYNHLGTDLWFYWLFKLQILSFWFGVGNGNPLQYSCLENPMDGGAW